MTNSLDLLNSIRDHASASYQDRIPVATQENLTKVGDLLTSVGFEDIYNEWMGAVGKIALTIFSNRAYTNPLSRFKKGKLPLGSTIEEIFVAIAKAQEFDATGADALKRVLPDAVTFYHSKEFFHTYSASISRAQVINAFNSVQSLDRFFTEVINALYSGYEQDEFLATRDLITSEIPNAYNIAIPFETGAGKLDWHAFGLKLVTEIRRMALNLTYISTKYNPLHFAVHTPRDRLALLIDSNVLANVGTNVLASAFNVGEVQWNVDIIPLPSLAYNNEEEGSISLASTTTKMTPIAVLIDSDSLLIYEKQKFMDRQHNGKGSFDTFYLQVNEMMGFSHVGNLICYNALPVEDAGGATSAIYGIGEMSALSGYHLMYKSADGNTYATMPVINKTDGDSTNGFHYNVPIVITCDGQKHDLSGVTDAPVNVILDTSKLVNALSPESVPTEWKTPNGQALTITSKSKNKLEGTLQITDTTEAGLLAINITSLTGAK